MFGSRGGDGADGAVPKATTIGWRAEQQLIRLVTKTQERRERLSALHGRLAAARADDEAAWAAVDQEQALTDRDDRRFGSLPAAFAIAIAVSVVDVLPAYWAAQALGNGVTDTWIVTGILVAGLTGVAWMMSHYWNRGGRRQFLAALFFTFWLILVEATLRVRYMLVVNDATWFDAALQGAVMAGISGVLVWIGYMKLVDAESYAAWKRRRAAHRASADLKMRQIEYDRTDAEYRQYFQALQQASFASASGNPRVVAAIDVELSMRPLARPKDEPGIDRFLHAAPPPHPAVPAETNGSNQ